MTNPSKHIFFRDFVPIVQHESLTRSNNYCVCYSNFRINIVNTTDTCPPDKTVEEFNTSELYSMLRSMFGIEPGDMAKMRQLVTYLNARGDTDFARAFRNILDKYDEKVD